MAALEKPPLMPQDRKGLSLPNRGKRRDHPILTALVGVKKKAWRAIPLVPRSVILLHLLALVQLGRYFIFDQPDRPTKFVRRVNLAFKVVRRSYAKRGRSCAARIVSWHGT